MRNSILILALAVFAIALPAKADTFVVFNPGNGCGGSTCFGNALTLTIHPTGGTGYHVTLEADTTGNTNVGTAIAGVQFKFATMTSATLTSAPGGLAGWDLSTSTLSANGCESGSQSPSCTVDFGFVGTFNAPSPTIGLAPLPHVGSYTWEYDVVATGTIDDISVRALFGTMDSSTTTLTADACPSGYTFSNGTCTKTTVVGTPTQGSCSAFPGSTKVGNQCVTKTTTSPACGAGYTLQTSGHDAGKCTKTVTEFSYKQTGLISASGPGTTVPEPGTMTLLGTGLFGLLGLHRRKRTVRVDARG